LLRAADEGRGEVAVLHEHLLQVMADRMTNQTYNVLFLCTGNSARSVMAEALATTQSCGRLNGFSAGSKPTGKVNPFAIEQVKKMGYPTENLRSKSWDEFAAPDAPGMDFIITVCDNAAGEACPIWPGHPATAHWGFEDPAAVEGTDEEKRASFERICGQIAKRMEALVSLPLHDLEPDAVRQALRKIGETPV
jgi:arsenate reductase